MARRKTLTIIGHSNAEGFAGSSPMLAAASHLATGGSPGGPDASIGGARYVYKNIKVFTNKIPFGGPNYAGSPVHSPVRATSPGFAVTTSQSPLSYTPSYDRTGSPFIGSPAYIKEGSWLDMTTAASTTPNQTSPWTHPHGSPYEYPNTRSVPVPPTTYKADGGTYSPWGNSYGNAGGGTLVGVELPLCWRLSHHYGENIYLVKLAIPGSFLMRHDQGLSTISNAYWWSPRDNFDWHPNTGRLYQAWKDKMTGAADALDAGDSLDLRLIVVWIGDNDSNQTSPRVEFFEQAYKALLAQIRTDIDDNDWSSLPAYQIPIAIININDAYDGSGERSTLNNILQTISDDDDYARYVKSDDWEMLSDVGVTDPALGPGGHFSHNGYLTAADDIYNAFIALETAAWDAFQTTGQVSLSTVRNRVLNYYERGQSRNDATTSIVNQHINAALFHILNRVGDNAYWLRRIVTLSLSGGPSTPINLPRNVHRLLRIETDNIPDYQLHFTLLGHTDAGRMRILLKERFQGSFNVHFITRVRALTKDTEIVPLPYDMIEWLVVETCRRLARASGNVPLQVSLHGESQALQADAMRNMQAVRRAAQDRLYGQRRMPTMRYGRARFGYPYLF